MRGRPLWTFARSVKKTLFDKGNLAGVHGTVTVSPFEAVGTTRCPAG